MKMRLWLVLCLCINTGFAKDLGVHGTLYPIEEDNMLEVIYERLDAMQENGKIEKMQEQLESRTRKSVARPKAVSGIQKTVTPRTYAYDPSVILDEDIRDHNGRLIHTRGTKINPLEVMSMDRVLVIIDGDDKKQVEWAVSQHGNNVKIVLVQGSIIDLMQTYEIPMYFDQGGAITRRLNIQFVPSRLRIEDKQAYIDEVVL